MNSEMNDANLSIHNKLVGSGQLRLNLPVLVHDRAIEASVARDDWNILLYHPPLLLKGSLTLCRWIGIHRRLIFCLLEPRRAFE